MKDAFKERERALESEFFRRVDVKLLADLRERLSAESAQAQLAESTGIADEILLDELMAAGVTAEAIAALSLVPLVLMAWADGSVDLKERACVLQAAREQGLEEGSAAAKLLESWLDERPGEELEVAWQDYTRTTVPRLGERSREKFRTHVLDGATAVARAAGGVLGIGSISAAERRVLVWLEEALFSTTPSE